MVKRKSKKQGSKLKSLKKKTKIIQTNRIFKIDMEINNLKKKNNRVL
jgi:hypothetical protein